MVRLSTKCRLLRCGKGVALLVTLTNGQKRYLKSHSVERVPFVNTGSLSRAATCGASAVAEKQTGLRCIQFGECLLMCDPARHLFHMRLVVQVSRLSLFAYCYVMFERQS
jgi:hypothetical protein